MEIDEELLESFIDNQTEEDVRQTAQQLCASAVAYGFFANGVESVSIEPGRDGLGRVDDVWIDWDDAITIGEMNLAVLKLAGQAWT